MSNDIDRLIEAMLHMLTSVEKLADMVEALDIRVKKLEAYRPPMFYPQYSPNEWPQYSPNEWPQPTKGAYPEYPTIKWNTACGIKNADSN